MEIFLLSGEKIVLAAPALYPLLAILYSLVSSLHCGLMCSSFLPEKSKLPYLYGRLISYTFLGMLFGALGEVLKISLQYQVLSFVSFFFFAFFTLSLLFSGFFSKNIKISLKIKSQSSWLRGLLSAFIPCHLLFFFYSFAALSGSWWLGGFILFSHGLATMPALSFGRKYLKDIFLKFHFGQCVVKVLILILCFINLIHFAKYWESQKTETAQQMICN